MRISDDLCEELRRRCLEQEGVALTIGEAREILSQMIVLMEHFAKWITKAQATDTPSAAHPAISNEI